MNAYTTKEELALLPANRVSYPEHLADARQARPGLLRTVASRISQFLERQRVMSELNGLTDRELSDIGLTRTELPLVFEPSFAKRR